MWKPDVDDGSSGRLRTGLPRNDRIDDRQETKGCQVAYALASLVLVEPSATPQSTSHNVMQIIGVARAQRLGREAQRYTSVTSGLHKMTTKIHANAHVV